jgi:hypothetical protein
VGSTLTQGLIYITVVVDGNEVEDVDQSCAQLLKYGDGCDWLELSRFVETMMLDKQKSMSWSQSNLIRLTREQTLRRWCWSRRFFAFHWASAISNVLVGSERTGTASSATTRTANIARTASRKVSGFPAYVLW